MLIINTGNGKGKTTSAMGQILRALGHNMKVCLIQVFKGKNFYGEQNIFPKLKNLKFYSYAPEHPNCFKNTDKKEVIKECYRALDRLENTLKSKKFDLIVFDELNIALRDGYLDIKDVLEVLNKAPKKIVLLITGRSAPKELIRMADTVTEMKEIKHAFNKGIKSMKGLEF